MPGLQNCTCYLSSMQSHQLERRRICKAEPNGNGTWTLGTVNPETGEFEPIGVAVGKVSHNNARQLVRHGAARWDFDTMPHIVLKSGKRVLFDF
jgi:hypothetical protein